MPDATFMVRVCLASLDSDVSKKQLSTEFKPQPLVQPKG